MRLSLSSFKGWVHIFLSLTHTYYLFLLSILACIKIPSQSYSGLSMQCCGIVILGFRSHMAKSHIKITFRRLKCNSRAISIKIILQFIACAVSFRKVLTIVGMWKTKSVTITVRQLFDIIKCVLIICQYFFSFFKKKNHGYPNTRISCLLEIHIVICESQTPEDAKLWRMMKG